MRLIALPSIYEKREKSKSNPERRRWVIIFTLAVGVIICLLPGVYTPSALTYCLVLAAGWILTVLMIAWLTSGRSLTQGELGENSALRELATLSDDFICITNCKIPGYEQIGDLDIVVLGSFGLLIIEVKNLSSRIIVDGDAWYTMSRYGPGVMKSVSEQLHDQVNALKNALIKSELNCDIYGVIAVNPTASIQIENPASYPIVSYSMLCEFVSKLEPRKIPISSEINNSLIKFLTDSEDIHYN